MRRFLLLAVLLVAGVLVVSGCSSSDNSNNNGESEDEVDESESDSQEYNETIEDNDSLKVDFIGLERIEDDLFDDEYYELTFEVENKLDNTIELQAREVSLDGKMFDDTTMSQEISGGKTADATLKIGGFSDNAPEIEEEIELTLKAMDFDDMDFEETIDVTIDVK